jgi:hemerythrin-like domain-containing protein
MTAGDVEAKVESEHARLRGMAAVLRSLALRVVRGDEDLRSALRLKGEELLERFDRHMCWEEDYLIPLLRRAGAKGEACGERLREDHRRQRDRLSSSLADLHNDDERSQDLARGLLDVIDWLERDMATEDARLLGSELLREVPRS